MNAVAASAAPSSASPARASQVLVAAAALVVLGGAAWWMTISRARSLAPLEAFEARFEPRELPWGLRVVQAEQLSRGDVVLRLEREGLEPEPERAKPVEPSKPGVDGKRFDWSKVDYGAPGAPPREVVIAELPLEHAKADLDALFKGGFELRGDWSSISDSGGKRVLRRDLVDWGELECAVVHEREFESGGTFRDVVRVNLSQAGEPRVLLARFGRGVSGSIEPVQALLEVLTLADTSSTSDQQP